MKRGEELRGKDRKLISIGKEKIHILNWVQLFAFCLFFLIIVFGCFKCVSLKVTSSRSQIHLGPRFTLVSASVLAAMFPLLIPNLSSELCLFPEMVL